MTKSSPSDKELLSFAQQVQELYELNVAKRKRILMFNFMKGMASGAGAFLGGIIMLTLLLWLVSHLGQVPFVGHLSQSVKQSIERQTTRA